MSAGKTIAGRRYLHRTLLEQAEAEQVEAVATALEMLRASVEPEFNVVRVAADGSEVAFLNYPDFFENPFPALKESWRVDRATGETGYRTYEDSLNPPILHRKELLLPDDHPGLAEYAALTEQAESIGLFDDPKRIGYRRQWEALVADAGYRIEGHALVPIGNLDGLSGEAADGDLALAEAGEGGVLSPDLVGLGGALDWGAARHRTAMVRYGFSAPVQTLARHGFLDGRNRLFDYGCGRGDDVRGLRENGLTASGWDPYFAPDAPISAADIVNLGFVINVIEDFDERLVALTRAWSLAERLLVVSVMLANQNDPRGERFRDGVMTQRGTFQRYYTQSEIKAYLEQVLDEEADSGRAGRALCVPRQGGGAAVSGGALQPQEQSAQGAGVRGLHRCRVSGRHGATARQNATTPIASRWSAFGRPGCFWGARRRKARSMICCP